MSIFYFISRIMIPNGACAQDYERERKACAAEKAGEPELAGAYRACAAPHEIREIYKTGKTIHEVWAGQRFDEEGRGI